MAILTDSPWVRSTDVLGSIEGGARLGLAQRGQQDEEKSASDQLRLAYDRLNLQQQNEQRAQALQRQQISAANALRKSQMDAMAAYRQKQQELAGQRISDQDTRAAAALAATQAWHDSQSDQAERRLARLESQPSLLDSDDYRDALADKKSAAKALDGLGPVTKDNMPAHEKAAAQLTAANQRIQSILGRFPARPPSTPATPAPAPADQSAAQLLTSGGASSGASGASPLSSGSTTPTNIPPAANATVRVKSPDGKMGTIPAAQLADAIEAGYTEIK